ncbi:selenocysteine synthase [Acinetobacter sp. S40]|uniref:selenocysteine synthase n=1 Tax=Acinetobacter sp. S40 TaxID=2767434 RepID=UPI00190E4458|nr:selenocysteine synthase [Acinetobacter sp. S40]MBJ9986561.1 selenocysteine synthase [Acinetobacter sp. S40]
MKRCPIVHFQLAIILSVCSVYAVWTVIHSLSKPYSSQLHPVYSGQNKLSESTCTESEQSSSQELLSVFGNDSLWARTLQQQPQAVKKFGQSHKGKSKKNKVSNPDPISASISTITSLLPFSNDVNLGSNSNSDVYVQFLAKKNWVLRHDISIDTQQLFRYGSTSKNYSETTLNLNQKLQDNTLFSNQFSLNKSQDEEYYWANRTFQQYQFLKNHRLIYGIYSSGVYDQEKKDWELQLWGPYLSWRRPLWRDWIFIDNQISYYHDLTTTDKELQHVFSTTLQLEANF